MGATDNINSWGRIRIGVKDAEQLIGKKQYNLSMVKCRQTLELMVRHLADKAYPPNSDLSTTIDVLYGNNFISKTTCDHYHKIRMIGNKAVHEGNDSAYHANEAFHLLSQEVHTFSKEYKNKKFRPSSSTLSKNRRSSRKSRSGKGFSLYQTDILRILAAISCVVFAIVILQFITSGKKENSNGTSSFVSSETTPPETTASPETMALTAPAAVYKSSTVLNVRSQPSTSGSKLGQIPTGTIVDYIGPENDDWVIITYEGQKAYVASQYLIHD